MSHRHQLYWLQESLFDHQHVNAIHAKAAKSRHHGCINPTLEVIFVDIELDGPFGRLHG